MTDTLTPKIGLWSVPCLWPGETVVCIGGGPSLTDKQVNYIRGKAKVIAINDAYRLAPWADVLYGSDAQWWTWHNGVPGFSGIKVCLRGAKDGAGYEGKWTSDLWPEVSSLANTGVDGLELDPRFLRTGKNSGYQAINLAVHFGARRIVLLGYDMQNTTISLSSDLRTKVKTAISDEHEIIQSAVMAALQVVTVDHWFGAHPDAIVDHSFDRMLKNFETLPGPLAEIGAEVINCTPGSALRSFPMGKLSEVLDG